MMNKSVDQVTDDNSRRLRSRTSGEILGTILDNMFCRRGGGALHRLY